MPSTVIHCRCLEKRKTEETAGQMHSVSKGVTVADRSVNVVEHTAVAINHAWWSVCWTQAPSTRKLAAGYTRQQAVARD